MQMWKNTKKTDCKKYKIHKDKTQTWQNTNITWKQIWQNTNVTKYKSDEIQINKMKMRKNTKKTDCKYYKIQKDKTQMWQNTNLTKYKSDKMQKYQI